MIIKVTKITTNVGEYDFDGSRSELLEKLNNLDNGHLNLKKEVKTIYRGEEYNDNIDIFLDMSHVNILSVEEHNMTKIEKVQKDSKSEKGKK